MTPTSDTPPPLSAAEPIALPASFAQELLWLMHRSSPESTAYNVPRLRRLRGALDASALQRALDFLVDRHEILRTTYASHGEQVVQAVHASRPADFELVDLSSVPETSREGAADRAARERMNRPFDLSSDVLLRATLFRLSADDHVLLLHSHHIAFDGWSRDILFRELDAAYTAFTSNAQPSLPALPIQYADFAIWQREHLAGDRLQSLLDYWRNALSGAALTLELPVDRPRMAHPGFDGATITMHLDPAEVEQLAALARANNATMYMVLLAAYMTVLHRHSGQDDVLVGSPVVGRTRPETEPLIGYFANTVVQRGSFTDDPSFATLLARVRESALGAYDHQEVPFERLVLDMGTTQDASRSPIFQVVFTQVGVADEETGRATLGTVTMEGFAVDAGATKFDITLLFGQKPTGIDLFLRYRTDLFSRGYAERFASHLRIVLAAATANPNVDLSRIALVNDAERRALAAFNETRVDEGRAATITALFEQHAARVPERLAVVGPRASATAAGSAAGTLALNYTELNGRANQLANHLQSLGVVANTPVGLLLDRDVDAIVGLMGILKSGGAYMPLAVEAPPSRLAQQISESGARVVVTSGAHAGKVASSTTTVALDRDASVLGVLPDSNLAAASTPSDLAYVLFTSGSTGVPKAVAVTHANAVHYARAVSRVLGDVAAETSGDGFDALDGLRFGMASTLAADLGNTSLLPSLLAGGTLHLLSKGVTTDPGRFAEYVGVHRFDVLKITPNHFAALTAGKTGAELAPLTPAKWLVLGGEALRLDVAKTLIGAATARVLNHYGPTETTVGALTNEITAESIAAAELEGARTAPIGRPLANTTAYVVSAHGEEQPVGIPGELWIGGAGLANGYLNRPELTAEKFTDFRGGRVYRTGDRARRLANGTIEFLGRADNQVKIRGFRVELGEIEQVLRRQPGVANGVVVLRDDPSGDARLVAYVVPKESGYAVSHSDRATPEKLTEWFAAQLPDYMVPSAVVMLDTLPLTSNGKVDAARLPAVDGAALAGDAFVAPETPTEMKLAAIWQDVLKRERIGRHDNFLNLGGHSLLAIRVLGKISKTFGVRLPLRTLFDAPTVQDLAQRVDDEARLAALEAMTDEEAERMLGGESGSTGP